MNWWQYLLLVNIYLVLFYGFYALLLRKETFFQLNRVYLVSAALLSFFIPVIQAGWVQNLFITQKVEYTIYSNPVIIRGFNPVAAVPVSFGQLFAYLYLAGVAFWGLRLVWQLITLNKIIKAPGQDAAYSFFKKIKMDKQADNSNVITAHEQVHAKQWHSADVLIIEAVMIINWFNPAVYFYRRAIKHIHEFIADSHAIKTAANKADYALLLLTQTFNAPQHQLVNHFFNNSLLKQRIIMLQKNKSQRIKLLKYGLSAPLFILMLILSSATVNNSKAVKIISKKAGQVFSTPVVTDVVLTPPADQSTGKPIIANVIIQPKQIQGTVDVAPDDTATKKDTDKAKDPAVFVTVEQEPTFPGGHYGFMQFLGKNITYPATMRQNGIKGRVIVTFIVEKDGSISNVKAIRGPGYGAEQEAERVIATSPKWSPGMQNGKPVRVQYTVPVTFELEGQVENMTVTPTRTDTNKLIVNNINLKPVDPDNEPLVVVDGKLINYDKLQLIDPKDIESISIFKDKATIAVYGPKAVNGVVVLTTKKKTIAPAAPAPVQKDK